VDRARPAQQPARTERASWLRCRPRPAPRRHGATRQPWRAGDIRCTFGSGRQPGIRAHHMPSSCRRP
jgi:hypothetical protein